MKMQEMNMKWMWAESGWMKPSEDVLHIIVYKKWMGAIMMSECWSMSGVNLVVLSFPLCVPLVLNVCMSLLICVINN